MKRIILLVVTAIMILNCSMSVCAEENITEESVVQNYEMKTRAVATDIKTITLEQVGRPTIPETPFKEDLSVDYDQLEKFIDFQIDNGTDSIVICGTSGEASTMSHDEQIEVVSACVSHVNGRVPVIAGAGANCTEEALNLAKRSEKVGADALLVVTPYYNKATQKGLEEYYATVGNSVDVPIIMYNVPGRTGTNIQPATAVKIAKSVDNIVAIKEASGDIGQVATLAALADGCLDIYSGNDDQVVPLLALGGKGVISVLSNVQPPHYKYLLQGSHQALAFQQFRKVLHHHCIW